MKIGDRYYCIKNCIDKRNNIRFKKGNYYYVSFIRANKIIDLRFIGGSFGACGFSTTKYTIGECPPLSDYFVTDKELRKLKIKNIYNVNK